METTEAVTTLAALAHEGRLAIFRALIQAGPEGIAAGLLGQEVGIVGSTLSNNLNVLTHAGLSQSRRDGRSIIYSADYSRMTGLLAFLMEDCCRGSEKVCGPLTAIVTQSTCCAAEAVQ